MIDKEKILGLIGLSMKAGKITFGTEAVEEAIERKKIRLIIVTEDAADRTIEKFKKLAEDNKISFAKFGEKDSLSKAIGKENKVVIGVKDKNLASQIFERIYGGGTIG